MQVAAADRVGRSRLADLYEAHSADAVRLAFALSGDRHVAEDVTQEAFLRLFTRFKDRAQPDSFERYLRTTIVNLCRSRGRRLSLERAYLERRGSREEPTAFPDVEGRDAMWLALQRLRLRQRAAVYFRYYEDKSLAEIAEILGCSVGAVKSLLLRALEGLRGQMEGEET